MMRRDDLREMTQDEFDAYFQSLSEEERLAQMGKMTLRELRERKVKPGMYLEVVQVPHMGVGDMTFTTGFRCPACQGMAKALRRLHATQEWLCKVCLGTRTHQDVAGQEGGIGRLRLMSEFHLSEEDAAYVLFSLTCLMEPGSADPSLDIWNAAREAFLAEGARTVGRLLNILGALLTLRASGGHEHVNQRPTR